MDKPILVTRSSMPPIDEYIEKMKELWDSHWLTNRGKFHKELEKNLKDYLDIENISLFTNGHMSLELAIQAMDLKGEVITTPFTYISTTQAIVRNGLKPVFCDINKDDYTIDVSKIESLITDKTCAIVPVHVYGNICDVDEINRIAEKYNLKVIYDAAHAFGECINNKSVGAFGDASMFSFHATKVFNTIEGGAVCFRDNDLSKKLDKLKAFGVESEEVADELGANAKMNEFQAIMGICNLEHLDEEIEKRKKIVQRYRENLKNINGINLVKEKEEIKYNYSYFPVLFDEDIFGHNRDEVCEQLSKNNIFARKYFYPLTSEFECFTSRFKINETPIAKEVSRKILTLPLYADLTIDEVDKICNIIINM